MSEGPPGPSNLPPPPPGPAAPVRPKVFSSDTVTVSYDHDASRWGVPDFLVTAALFVAASIGALFLVRAITGASGVPTGPGLLAVVAIPPIAELLYVIWVGRAKGQGLADDFRLRYRSGDLGLGANLFGLAIVGAVAIVAVWSAFGMPPSAAATDLAQDSSDSVTIWIVFFAIVGATLIPLIEEVVFRGLFWSALEKRGHGPMFVWIVSSAIFSLFHLEPARIPILFVIGLVIGLGRLRTGRIGASIVAHMMINSLAMVGLLAELA